MLSCCHNEIPPGSPFIAYQAANCFAALSLLSLVSVPSERLPALTWLHPVNGASIVRSSQPLVGLVGHRNSADELLLESVRQAGPDPARLFVIIDVRPKLNAVANQVCGHCLKL